MTDPRPPAEPGTMSAAQAAALLDLTERRVQQLAREGVIPKASHGRYPVAGAVRGYIGYLRDEVRRSTETAAGAALKATRQAEIELRMAERQRELVPRAEADAAMDMVVGVVNEEFGGFAARVTRDRQIRNVIEKEMDTTLNRIADRLDQAHEVLAEEPRRDPRSRRC